MTPSNRIHATALVDPTAVLGVGNVIGPYTVIGAGVSIGDGNWIGSHVVIGAPAEMRGRPHAAFGEPDPVGPVVVGSDCFIREFTTIQGPSIERTVVEDDCYLMDKVHVAHDNHLCQGVTVAPCVVFAGHVSVGAGANVGVSASVHQWRVIGPSAMVGMGAVVTRDVPPFVTVVGTPARPSGWNRVGMERAELGAETVARLVSCPPGEFPEGLGAPVVDDACGWFELHRH